MPPHSEKLRILRDLDEATFRTDVLVPLLRKMGYDNVRETHGPNEFGVDIAFRETSPLSTSIVGIVAKVGNISGAASGKENLNTILNQINMSFDVPIEDVGEKKTSRVSRVIVWTTGKIVPHAQHQIIHSLSDKFRNVDFKDGQATIELLERYYPAFFTIRDPYVSDYFAAVKEFHSRLEELRTLGCFSEHRRLPVIFVPPMLMTLEGSRRQQKSVFDPDSIRQNSLSFDKVLNMLQNMIVLGSAGTGKSVLLRRILLETIEDNEQSQRRVPIPILIEFKKLDLSDSLGLEKALNQEFSRFDSSGLAQDLGTDLVDGSVLVLLDGLDELKTEDRIIQALDHVKEFGLRYPKNRIVLTSRLLEILEKPDMLPGFRVLQISSLTPTQMTQFIENWFGKDSPVGKRLVQFVNEPMSLRGLPATPLTLALVASLYEGGTKEIPSNLTELFSKYVELALGRWDISRDISLQFEWEVKKFILQKIAWDMQVQRKSEINILDFESAVKRFSTERGLSVDAGAYSKEVMDRSELMFLNNNNEYEFKHRALHEYFVGSEINDRADSIKIVVDNFLDLWWSQSIFFACGLRPQGEDLLKAITDQVKPSNSDQFTYGLLLGEVTQASYLAPKQVKADAIKRVIENLTEAWDYFSNDFRANENIPVIANQLPVHMFFLALQIAFAQLSLGSITLSSVLSDLAEQLCSQSGVETSPREIAKREWRALLLAMASARCDNVNDFIKIFESNIISDPSFLFFGRFYAEDISKRDWIPRDDRVRAKQLSKKLAKRVGKQKKYFSSLQGKGPIPLPPPEISRTG